VRHRRWIWTRSGSWTTTRTRSFWTFIDNWHCRRYTWNTVVVCFAVESGYDTNAHATHMAANAAGFYINPIFATRHVELAVENCRRRASFAMTEIGRDHITMVKFQFLLHLSLEEVPARLRAYMHCHRHYELDGPLSGAAVSFLSNPRRRQNTTVPSAVAFTSESATRQAC
jgi:hypothetical protein